MSAPVVRLPWRGRCAPSPRVLRACSIFALAIDRRASRALSPQSPARAILHRLRSIAPPRQGRSILLTGPSGCGKSTLLRDLVKLARQRGERVITVSAACPARDARTPIVDLFHGPVDRALALLARAGLAEAMLLARTPAELSDGERARFFLARAMARATMRSARPARRTTLVCDEFTSVLDRATAQGVASSLARFVASSPRLTLLVASPHDDLAAALHPALHAHGTLQGDQSARTQHGDHACTWTISTSAKVRSTTTSRSSASTTEQQRPRPARESSSPPNRAAPRPLASSSSRVPRSTAAGATPPGPASARRSGT